MTNRAIKKKNQEIYLNQKLLETKVRERILKVKEDRRIRKKGRD